MDLRNYGTTLSKPINPPFSYTGSKRKHANKIKQFFPRDLTKYDRFVEPFCGSGAMTLNLQPSKALLNDINPDIKNVYDAIRYHSDTFNRDISKFKKDKDTYYSIRAWDRQKFFENTSSYARALRLVYISKLCFGGSPRYNLKNQLNEAYNNRDWINVCIPNIEEINNYLTNNDVEVTVKDYHDLELSKSDFVYVDSPYHSVRPMRSQYWGYNWKDDSFRELFDWLCDLDSRGIDFCMSNFGTELITELSQKNGFSIDEITVKHDIGSFVRDTTVVTEVLVRNYSD